MPLTSTGAILGKSIASALGITEPTAVANWVKISTAIVDHIVANSAIVVDSVSGVTTGPGVSGPGKGSIK